MRHHNDLPVRLTLPDEIIELGINRPVIEIVFRLINKDRVSRIAQVKDQVKQHQTPFAWRHLHDIVAAVTDRKINQVAVIIEITQNIRILNALTKSGSNPAASVTVIDACNRFRMAISGKCVAAFRVGQIAEQEVYVPCVPSLEIPANVIVTRFMMPLVMLPPKCHQPYAWLECGFRHGKSDMKG